MSWPDFISVLGTALHAIGWVFLPLVFLPAVTLVLHKNAFIQRLNTAIIRTIDSMNYALGELIKWALPILVLTVAFSVFALSIFGLSWTKLFESAQYFHATVIMLGAGATLLAGQHVRVDVFHTRMGPPARALVDFCGFYLFLLPVCLIILWNSQSSTSFTWRILEGSAEADGIKGVFLLQTLVPLFALLMIVQGLAIALRAALRLRGKRLPERPPQTPPFFEEQERQL